MNDEYTTHQTWAVTDDMGFLLTAYDGIDAFQAYAEAQRQFADRGMVVLDTVYEMQSPADAQAPLAANVRRLEVMPGKALRAASLPKLSDDDVFAYSYEEAHELIRPYLPDKPTWQRPEYALENFLRTNAKMQKSPPGPGPRYVSKGLSLAPNAMAFQRMGEEKRPSRRLPQGGQTRTFCVGSNEFCRATCLVYSGRQTMKRKGESEAYPLTLKVAFSEALVREPAAFTRVLVESIRVFTDEATRCREVPMVRLNVLSDLPWELIYPLMFEHFSDVQFYDYTKVFGRSVAENYDLTFSFSGTNYRQCDRELERGLRVATVFFVERGMALPKTWRGVEVVDGDDLDLRPLNPPGVIVGLTFKTPNTDLLAVRGKAAKAQAAGVFVVPCWIEDGQVVAAETPRQTDAFWFDYVD